MRTLALLAASAAALAQNGDDLFRVNCAVPYCHGPNGTAGRAPAVAGRNYTRERLLAIVRDGIRGTAMPGFSSQLSGARIAAIVDYVLSLGNPNAAAGNATAPELPAVAKPGRAFFFDATRTGNCGTCHESGGWGIPIGPALGGESHNFDAIATPNVVTARIGSESPFPALVAAKSAAEVRLYDLSAVLPVLRTVAPSSVTIEPRSGWTHQRALSLYTAAELNAIAEFLKSTR